MKVLITTPTHDGRLDARYVDALITTERMFAGIGVECNHLFMMGDAIVQKARNELLQMTREIAPDKVLMIDADMLWNPQDAVRLAMSEADFIGAAGRLKTDSERIFAYIPMPGEEPDANGIIKCKTLGAAFLCVSKRAVGAIWEAAPRYDRLGVEYRAAFGVEIVDGELYGEDAALCRLWRDAGGDVLLDTTIALGHIGEKVYSGRVADAFAAQPETQDTTRQ